jgi:hypothetical protein
MVRELTLAAAESKFMSRFSPIYQATGLFCPFTVKSWVLVSWLTNPASPTRFLINHILQFIEARFKDG